MEDALIIIICIAIMIAMYILAHHAKGNVGLIGLRILLFLLKIISNIF